MVLLAPQEWMLMLSIILLIIQGVSTDLHVGNTLAAVAKWLCTVNVHASGTITFVACQLIPSNKNPGTAEDSDDVHVHVKAAAGLCKPVLDMKQDVRPQYMGLFWLLNDHLLQWCGDWFGALSWLSAISTRFTMFRLPRRVGRDRSFLS